ncbi:hypothetical protein VPH35_017482 [Triticum aestivum]
MLDLIGPEGFCQRAGCWRGQVIPVSAWSQCSPGFFRSSGSKTDSYSYSLNLLQDLCFDGQRRRVKKVLTFPEKKRVLTYSGQSVSVRLTQRRKALCSSDPIRAYLPPPPRPNLTRAGKP